VTAKNQILVVEDNAELAEMLQVHFIGEGYQIRTKGKGKDAVRMVE